MNDAGDTEADERPLIVGFVSDLMFAVRIEGAADGLGYRVQWIERSGDVSTEVRSKLLDATTVSPAGAPYAGRSLGEPMTGAAAGLVDRLTRWRPALLLFDLGNREIPWREWIPLLKSIAATRRMPVVCYGSHVDAESLTAARQGGADAVMARSHFAADLPAIIQKYARHLDREALALDCAGPLLPEALQGLEEFNRGEYFEAHESLEAAWKADASLGRELYRAVLQVAVAYLQIERGNYRGALKMFLRMRQWIDPLPDRCRGIDVARLRADARRAYEHLLALGPERIGEFDVRFMKPVVYEEGDEVIRS